MEKSHKLFGFLFNNNSITSLTDTENLFNSIFSNFIAPQLLDSELQNLNAKFEETEIFNNLKALHQKGPSSPGPDGITYAAWFHSWEYSKLHIIQFINQIHFSTSQASQTVNSHSSIFNSIIKLIPKKNFDPKEPNPGNLRPISLTNTIFRLYNYTLTRRSMNIFNRLISPHQQAFLPNRDIHLHIQTTKIIANYINAAPTITRFSLTS